MVWSILNSNHYLIYDIMFVCILRVRMFGPGGGAALNRLIDWSFNYECNEQNQKVWTKKINMI